ncbi:hypothetical protein RQM59_07865 [Flavobacteriaceae bacterium S356]|uniref:TNase-like domain-containing protein n=1 Tax=Asprobacillus argus TaxID=3076534 RepID=A0ABU3LFC7_9FLAO|nr:hypothetical protein [Flavobacteriaceae bacterium S356]
MKKYVPLLLVVVILSCKTAKQHQSDAPLEVDKSINLYAFIGKKISVDEFEVKNKIVYSIDSITNDTIKNTSVAMDRGFNATYQVLKPVFNDLKVDTIQFKVFNHYGRPYFEKHKTALLYISKGDGYFYLQKYQYDVVKKKKGIWKGKKGRSLQELFNAKKQGVFKARELFSKK